MEISMETIFQILEKRDGKYVSMSNREARSVSIGAFSFVINGKTIPFDWDAATGHEDSRKFYFETGTGWFNDYELSDCYDEDYAELGITRADITAKYLASVSKIEDFFVFFETHAGNEGNAGWFADNLTDDAQYKLSLLEVKFQDVDTGETYSVSQEVLDTFNGIKH